jgi:hypothetical protein
MAIPTSRQTLIDYCLRKLGAPVIEINVDDDQVSDRVDEALQFYQEYHSDAVIRTYLKHQITATDVTNKYVDIPDRLLFVSRIFPMTNNSSSSSGMWSARYQMHLNDVYDLQYAGALVNYEMTRQFLEMLDMQLNGVPPVRFNRHMNRLFIDVDFGRTIIEGDYIMIDAYTTIDPDTYTDIYNDIFLKKYTTALIKRQWGANLIKFEGIQLPGGVTMNGRQIWDDANAEIEKLEEEMELKYEKPVDFFVG